MRSFVQGLIVIVVRLASKLQFTFAFQEVAFYLHSAEVRFIYGLIL